MNDTKLYNTKNKKNNNIAVKKKQTKVKQKQTNVDWKVIDEIFKLK